MIAPGAEWRGPVPNHSAGGMRSPSLGLVLHVIEGSLSAADSAFHNPAWRASAHWGIGDDGHLVQWVDTGDKAWAEVAGNPDYHSVETEGWNTAPLTGPQVATLARLYRWGHDTFGWPYLTAEHPGDRGLAWHGMGGGAWGGHTSCPGDQRRAQRAAVLILAEGGDEDLTPEQAQQLAEVHAGVAQLNAWFSTAFTPAEPNLYNSFIENYRRLKRLAGG